MKFSFTGSHIREAAFQEFSTELSDYRKHLANIRQQMTYDAPESSLCLPFDENQLAQAKSIADLLRTSTLQYVIVIGIGGSNLGAQAVYEAIAGSMHLLVDRLPKLLFLDTVSDEKMTAITRILERLPRPEDFAILLISKSGTTTETIANALVLAEFLHEQFGGVWNRWGVVTDEGSKLWVMAEQKKMARIAIPQTVGGRFSVCSAVGLLPLLLANIDVDELLDGARQAVQDSLDPYPDQNHALTSAILCAEHIRAGRLIHNRFYFSPKFETLGKWERQLIGESLGKNGKGIVPIVSIGSTDLHSMAQLYWDGPDMMFTSLISVFTGMVHGIPTNATMPGLVPDIQGTSLEDLMRAIYGGVKSAYETTRRPYVEIELQRADAWEIGYYLQFRMVETMYLGRLLEVNPFDQPAVELYKQTTRDLLKTQRPGFQMSP